MKINVETLVANNYKYVARDMNGEIYALKMNRVSQQTLLVILGMLKKVKF